MIESEKGKNLTVEHYCDENCENSSLSSGPDKNKKPSQKCLECEHTCKYHRFGNEKYNLKNLGPPGICLDLYHSAYPYALALLHGAKFKWMKTDCDVVHAQCPAPTNPVHFEVRRIPLEKVIENNGVKKDKLIMIKIKSIGENTGSYENGCICPHSVGQEYEFNQGDLLEQMCPAAFHELWPTIKTLLNNGKNIWSKEGTIHMRCPDNVPKIKFKIKKE